MVMTIREILNTTGMTQVALSKRFDIPLRTVQNWATGQRECPVYIRKMIIEILRLE
jgi:DNA-binding transcriptional regulator YiaG